MRISLTALTTEGPWDVVIHGDSEMTVEAVATSLHRALNTGNTGESVAQVVRLPRPRDASDDRRVSHGHLTSSGLGSTPPRGTERTPASPHTGPPPAGPSGRRPAAAERQRPGGPAGGRPALWADGRMLDPQAPAV